MNTKSKYFTHVTFGAHSVKLFCDLTLKQTIILYVIGLTKCSHTLTLLQNCNKVAGYLWSVDAASLHAGVCSSPGFPSQVPRAGRTPRILTPGSYTWVGNAWLGTAEQTGIQTLHSRTPGRIVCIVFHLNHVMVNYCKYNIFLLCFNFMFFVKKIKLLKLLHEFVTSLS